MAACGPLDLIPSSCCYPIFAFIALWPLDSYFYLNIISIVPLLVHTFHSISQAGYPLSEFSRLYFVFYLIGDGLWLSFRLGSQLRLIIILHSPSKLFIRKLNFFYFLINVSYPAITLRRCWLMTAFDRVRKSENLPWNLLHHKIRLTIFCILSFTSIYCSIILFFIYG